MASSQSKHLAEHLVEVSQHVGALATIGAERPEVLFQLASVIMQHVKTSCASSYADSSIKELRTKFLNAT